MNNIIKEIMENHKELVDQFQVGYYRHYKGSIYFAHGLGISESRKIPTVMYTEGLTKTEDTIPLIRDLDVWLESAPQDDTNKTGQKERFKYFETIDDNDKNFDDKSWLVVLKQTYYPSVFEVATKEQALILYNNLKADNFPNEEMIDSRKLYISEIVKVYGNLTENVEW